MIEVSRDLLWAYIDDALSDSEIAQIEQTLRQSPDLRDILKQVIQERDRGEHTVGAIWRRARLTCPTREQLGSYLLEALEPDLQEYVDFHLATVACSFCEANVADLRSKQESATPSSQKRRQRYFQSSAGYLPR